MARYVLRGKQAVVRNAGEIELKANLGTVYTWWTIRVINPGDRYSDGVSLSLR